jgi:hypothetical protein
MNEEIIQMVARQIHEASLSGESQVYNGAMPCGLRTDWLADLLRQHLSQEVPA